MEKIGFIGIGIMGKPMCLNLLKAGYQVVAHDIVQQAIDDVVNEGATSAHHLKLLPNKVMLSLPCCQIHPRLKKLFWELPALVKDYDPECYLLICLQLLRKPQKKY